MNENMKRLFNGLIKENPTFVLMLGMCPTLAVTTSAINGLGMGLSTTVVLIFDTPTYFPTKKVMLWIRWFQSRPIYLINIYRPIKMSIFQIS